MKLLERLMTNWERVEWRHTSQWNAPAAPRAGDMESFGPDALPDRWAKQPPGPGTQKETRYVPLVRRNKQIVYPDLSLTIRLEVLEHGDQALAKYEGAAVEIEVVNLWNPDEPRRLKLAAARLKGGECTVRLKEEDFKKWLDPDPKAQLKALLNENLLDFTFRIPSMQVQGKAFEGSSSNRVFLYCRRNVVFFPGVFGSQVQFKDDNGDVVGFPHWDKHAPLLPNAYTDALYIRRLIRQQIGILECDADGVPLVKTDLKVNKPLLLVMHVHVKWLFSKSFVADVFRQLHAARMKWHGPVPEKFMLYRLIAQPYDWREDLEQSARGLWKQLHDLQADNLGRNSTDYDDQLTLVGHSTGGLLIRRIMRMPQAEGLVDKVFFVNVPFRGAVKPVAVIPTGCDPLVGPSMIPFVEPESLVSIALTAPIVYHLSVTALAKHDVFKLKVDGSVQTFQGIEGIRAFIQLCIRIGFMPKRKVLEPAKATSESERRRLALESPDWHAFWNERFEHQRSHRILSWSRQANDQLEAEAWEAAEIARRGLGHQNEVRKEVGWSVDALETAATAFHQRCEEGNLDTNNGWLDRAHLFYSVHDDVPTTLGVEAERESVEHFGSLLPLLKAVGIPIHALDQPHPLLREKIDPTLRAPDEPFERGVWRVEHVEREGAGYRREVWRLTTLQHCKGDGTVPLWSQLGFGSRVKVFKKLLNQGGMDYPTDTTVNPAGPAHMDAPNNPFLWSCVVQVLQGHDVTSHLAPEDEVDTVEGTDTDKRLEPSENFWMNMDYRFGPPGHRNRK